MVWAPMAIEAQYTIQLAFTKPRLLGKIMDHRKKIAIDTNGELKRQRNRESMRVGRAADLAAGRVLPRPKAKGTARAKAAAAARARAAAAAPPILALEDGSIHG